MYDTGFSLWALQCVSNLVWSIYTMCIFMEWPIKQNDQKGMNMPWILFALYIHSNDYHYNDRSNASSRKRFRLRKGFLWAPYMKGMELDVLLEERSTKNKCIFFHKLSMKKNDNYKRICLMEAILAACIELVNLHHYDWGNGSSYNCLFFSEEHQAVSLRKPIVFGHLPFCSFYKNTH